MILITSHRKCYHHPNQRCEPTYLTNDEIQRLDCPLLLCLIPTHVIQYSEITSLDTSGSIRDLTLKSIRFEVVTQIKEGESTQIQEKVVKDADTSLLNLIEAIEWRIRANRLILNSLRRACVIKHTFLTEIRSIIEGRYIGHEDLRIFQYLFVSISFGLNLDAKITDLVKIVQPA